MVRKWGDSALKALQTPLVCGLAHSEIFHHPICGLKPNKLIIHRKAYGYSRQDVVWFRAAKGGKHDAKNFGRLLFRKHYTLSENNDT